MGANAMPHWLFPALVRLTLAGIAFYFVVLWLAPKTDMAWAVGLFAILVCLAAILLRLVTEARKP